MPLVSLASLNAAAQLLHVVSVCYVDYVEIECFELLINWVR